MEGAADALRRIVEGAATKASISSGDTGVSPSLDRRTGTSGVVVSGVWTPFSRLDMDVLPFKLSNRK